MKTELHLKLEKLCRRLKNEPRHWFITGSGSMWMPEIQDHVSVKRAIYAAFVEDVPEDMEVRATKCEASRCVNPEHCSLVPARGVANKALSFSWHREQLSMPKKFIPPTPKGKLPVGITHELVAKVKTMSKAGSTLGQIQLVTKVSLKEIVLIRNGSYDRAAGRAKRDSGRRLSELDVQMPEPRARVLGQLPPCETSILIIQKPQRTTTPVDDDNLSAGQDSDEQIWLDMMRNK